MKKQNVSSESVAKKLLTAVLGFNNEVAKKKERTPAEKRHLLRIRAALALNKNS